MTHRPAWPALDTDPGDTLWLPVEDAGSVGTARRAAESVARDIGLPTARTADLAIVATELATNLFRHAVEGVLLARAVRRGDVGGVQVVAVDAGPGMRDLTESVRDGHSTSGTLGIGLGAVTRKATEFDAYSLPGAGTVVVATVLPVDRETQAGRRDESAGGAAGISRPMTGEAVCGDAYAARMLGPRAQLMLCDGLGHGPLAAVAAQAAVAAFRDAPAAGPKVVVEHLHRSLGHTRGAVVTVVELDPARARARFAGLGNVFAAIQDGSRRHPMMPQPGIAGNGKPLIRELEVSLPRGAIMVMHSDGVRDRWSLADYPGLVARTPLVIAATLLRDAGVRLDDAAVLVAKVGHE